MSVCLSAVQKDVKVFLKLQLISYNRKKYIIIYPKALAKQEEPKQLLGCSKNGCRFLNCRLPVIKEENTECAF